MASLDCQFVVFSKEGLFFLKTFSLEIFENEWLWTAASEQFKIPVFDLIQFLI